jgi:hypothetical protein
LGAKRLSGFWRVNPFETHFVLLIVAVEQRERVAVRNSDHTALDYALLRRDGQGDDEKQPRDEDDSFIRHSLN